MASQYILEALIKATSGDARRELGRFDDSLEKVADKTEKAGKRMKLSLSSITTGALALGVGIAGAVATVVKGLDALEKGAQLQQVEKNFSTLAATIQTDAGTLKAALDDAARGMVDSATLMGSANMLITMGLASSKEEVASLVEMATQLGRGGSAGQNIADFAATLANQSIERLDTFGISSGRVRTRIDELIKSGQALNREEAFKLAVLEEGAKSMERLGEQSVNMASVVKAQFADIRDQIIRDVTAGAQPAVEEFANETLPALAKAAQEAAPHVVSALTSIGKQAELMAKNASMREVRRELKELGLTAGELRDVMDTDFSGFRLFRNTEQFTEDIQAQERATMRLTLAQEAIAKGFTGTNEELVDLVDVMYAARVRAEGMNNAYEDLQASTEGVNDEIATQVRQIGDLTRANPQLLEQMGRKNSLLSDEEAAIARANAANRAYFDAQRQAREEAEKSAEAVREWADSFMEGNGAIDDYIEALRDAEESQGEWRQYTLTNAREIAGINEQLGKDLSDETKKTYTEILRTAEEGGEEWLRTYDALQDDLTESQRDALVRQRADLIAQQGEVRSYYTGDADAHQEAVDRMRAAEQQLAQDVKARAFEQLLASIATKEGRDVALDAAVKAGVLSQEEATLRQRYYDTKEALDDVILRYEAGLIPTAEAAANAVNNLTAMLLGQITVLYDAKAAADNYKAGLDAINNMDINNPYGDSRGAGGTTDTGSNGTDRYRAMGGSVYAGRTYVVGERGPELFTPTRGGVIVPNHVLQQQAAAAANAGNVTYNNQRTSSPSMTLNVQTVMPAVSVIREFRLMQAMMGGV